MVSRFLARQSDHWAVTHTFHQIEDPRVLIKGKRS
jgi:hypothetical protein